MTPQYRILVVGTGSIGERHLRCLLSTGRVVAGLVEPIPERRVKVAADYRVAEVFSTLQEALALEWSGVVIATPAPLHIPMARECCRAGIPILVEKPLSTTVEGIPELIQEVCKEKLVAGVAYVYRCHPGAVWLREQIGSGRFGKPVQILFAGGQFFPLYRPAYRDIYYRDRKQGGGAIQDALTHYLNLGEWLVGPIDRVVADAAHQVLEGVEVEDTVHCLTRQGMVMGSYTLNQHQAPNETTLTVVCERGTLRFDLHKNRCRYATEPGGPWTDQDLPTLERDDWFRLQANHFLDCIAGKAQPACSLEEAFQTLQVTLAILDQVDAGRGLEAP